MKLIHCADLHLDSPLTSVFPGKMAVERRSELLLNFFRLADRAGEEGAKAVLIAGDLFDSEVVSRSAADAVLSAVEGHPEITFFYIRGNHDDAGFSLKNRVPENLRMFPEGKFASFHLGKGGAGIRVTGAELPADGRTDESFWQSLRLDPRNYNIVLLHGLLADVKTGAPEELPAEYLRNKGIDYLALGHIHKPSEGKLDARGTYAYPGCLEARGFDEPGEHGFWLLDIDEENMTMKRTFVPFARRIVHEIPVDVTGLSGTGEIAARAAEVFQTAGPGGNPIPEKDLVKAVLTGEFEAAGEKNLALLQKQFEDRFYRIRFMDETGIRVNYRDYELDTSLKGEFVRQVRASRTLSEKQKEEVIRCGLLALLGEEDGE